MGQDDILEMLREKRQETEEWLDLQQIRDAMVERGHSDLSLGKTLCKQIGKLVRFNRIDWKNIGVWNRKRVFRAKKK